MMKKILYRLILLALALLSQQVYAQDKSISGIITDETGKPMEFVSVVVKGTSNGTISAEDGSFSLKIPQDATTLVCSFVGYASLEVNISASPINVKMKMAGNLDELVVVGYGTQSRQKVTSSIAKLDQDVLTNTPRANIGSALQGTLPGLQVVNSSGSPGATPLILLRGGASINSPGAPLIVVDGIITAYNDIASEDIASVELLKDAASTAIYGARANNGVILITTKQGKIGTSQISYKYTNGLNRRRESYKYLNAKDFITYTRQGNLNSQVSAAAVETRRGFGLLTDTANLSSFDIRRYTAANANLLSSGWDTVADPYGGGPIIFKDHGGEIEDLIFRDTRTDDHYINFMGGNEKGKYFASFDYYKEKGVIVGSDYKRFSGDINGSYRVKPNVEVTTGATFSTSSQLGTLGSEVNTIYRNLNVWPTFNPWIDAAKTIPNPGNGNTDGNPLYWLGKTDRRNEVNRITANASVKWDIIPGLFVKGTAAGYLFEGIDESFTRATQLYNNIYRNPQNYSNTSRPSSSSFGRSFQQQYNAIINYSKTFNKVHNTEIMLGTEYYGTKAYDLQAAGTNAPTDDIGTVNAATTFGAGSNFSSKSEYRIASTFGRFNYDYDNRFLLTLVFRRDGVSSLAEANRFGFFPGMSAGWNLHKEPFFQNSKLANVISTLKPRISYGQNGNVSGLGRYEVQGGYGSTGLYNGNATFLNTGIINTDLRWEKSKTTDAGLDLGLFNNKVTLLFDYYDRITSDLLTNLALPGYTGFNSLRTNLGTYQNKGYEMAVNANVFNKPNGLKIDIGANASFVKNKILKLPTNGNENNRQGGLQIFDPATGKVIWVGGLQEGQTLGDIYAYKQLSIVKNTSELETLANRWDAIALIGGSNRPGTNKISLGDVNWSDLDKNDTIDSRDQVRIGNIFPKWTGGFSLNASYKGFSLYTRFEFAVGHTIYNDFVARTMGNFQGTFNYIDLMKQSWSPTNPDSDIPRVYYADQVAAPNGKKNYTRNNNGSANLNSNNSRFYEKGDYLASREVTLSYNFPKSLLAKTKYVSQLRVYVSGNNLAYLTKFTGPTPEAPVSGGTITGVYGGAYPIPKSYVMGVQVSF